jgi:FMN phosphatase YigB (HAD superfamily)
MITTVVFDLDDTLYDELDYCRSGFRAVAASIADLPDAASANCILLEHYLSQKSYTPCYWIDTQDLSGTSGELRQAEAFKKLREAVAARSQIWLSRDHAVFFSVLKRNGYEITRFKDMYVATARD